MAYFNGQPGGFQGQSFYGQPNAYYNNVFQGQGYQYAPPQHPVKIENILTQDEISYLTKDKNKFSLALTEEERLRAFCNHQWNPDNIPPQFQNQYQNQYQDALVEDPIDGKVVCQICGYKFKPLDAFNTTKEVLQGYVDSIVDVLQTIKLIYFDLDKTVAREYFQIIPLIERIPGLFDIAAKNYAKHDHVMPWSANGKNMSTMQAYAVISGMLNGGMPNPGMYQQAPQYQQPFGNPGAMYQQPYGATPQYGVPSNGFGYNGAYGAPQQYQTQTQGFQTVYGDPNQQAQQQAAPQPQQQGFQTIYGDPNQPQPAPAPVNTQPGAPEAATATTDGNTKTVAASFKA